MISAAHRHLCRVLARLYRETQRREFGLNFVAGRADIPTDVAHQRCLELREMGIISFPAENVIKLEADLLPALLAA